MYLVQAEFASFKRQFRLARIKYLNAIALAAEFGNLLYRGTACKCFARFLRQQRDDPRALKYFREACTAYTNWGGTILVELLEKEFSDLLQR